MKPVRGMITSAQQPDGALAPRGVHLLIVELVRSDDRPGPFGRPVHPTADGVPCLRDVIDNSIYLVEDLPPDSHLRVIDSPSDDEGRQLLAAIVKKGLPLADSPLRGNAKNRHTLRDALILSGAIGAGLVLGGLAAVVPPGAALWVRVLVGLGVGVATIFSFVITIGVWIAARDE